MMARRRYIVLTALLAGMVVLATGVGVWLWRGRQPELYGLVLDRPREVPRVPLQASDGQTRALQDYRGKVVLVYFGYTTCPDVCPMTLSTLARARDMLGSQAGQVQVAMVTVDPERDTAERLKEYLGRYGDGFVGLTGDDAQIQEVATAFGVYYARYESGSALGYLVEHTASTFVLDRQGRLRIAVPYGALPEQVAADVRYLLKEE